MKTGRKGTWSAAALVVATIGLVSLPGCRCDSEPKPDVKQTTTFAIDAAAVASSLPIIAAEKGFFEDEKVQVKIAKFTTGRDCLQALLGGKVDFATVADYPFMIAIDKGHDLRLITSICEAPDGLQIVGNRKRGIENLSDLRGKSIGVSVGTVGQFDLDTMMKHGGIEQGDYKPVNLGPPEMAAVFGRGDVDAICTWEPHLTNAKKELGLGNTVSFSDEKVYALTFNVAVSADYAKQHLEATEAVLRGLKKAQEYFESNPDDAAAIVAKSIQMEKETAKALMLKYGLRLTLRARLPKQLREQFEWAVGAGVLDEDAQPRQWIEYIDGSFLERLSPDSVSMDPN